MKTKFYFLIFCLFFVAKISYGQNNSLKFDGTNDYVDFGQMNAIKGVPQMTMEGWFKLNSAVAFGGIMGRAGTATDALYIYLGSGANSPDLYLQLNNGSATSHVFTGFFTYGTWVHLALVFDGTQAINADRVKVYKNGVLQTPSGTSGTFPATTHATPAPTFKINAAAYPVNMEVDEVRIWNTARTCDQILAVKDRELLGNEAGLVSYYNFNQGTAGGTNTGIVAPEITDNKTTGTNHGTLTNFAKTGVSSNWITSSNGVTGTTPVPQPEINLQGNSSNIVKGSTIPSLTNHSDFGGSIVSSPLSRIFTIQNTGTAVLNISSIVSSGTNAAEFVVSGAPASVAAGNSATFTVTFTPTTAGIRTATITVNDDDCDEGTYDFAIKGTGNSTFNINTLSPNRNAINQNNNTSISANLNLPIDGGTLNFNNAKIYGSQTGFYTAGAWTGAGTSNISYTPTIYPFKKGETVTVEYRNTLQSGGLGFATTQQYQFTAATTGNSNNIFSKPNPDVATSGTGLRVVQAFDADGDGDMDLVTSNQTSANISVLKNNGDGTYATATTYAAGGTSAYVCAFDADGDGDMDIASANQSSDNIGILQNNGDGTYTAPTTYGVTANPNNPNAICAFDADGDGDIDLATANGGGNNISVFKNNGNGTFTANINYGLSGLGAYAINAFDADSDGDMDLAVANSSSGTIDILKNDGTGAFSIFATYFAGDGVSGVRGIHAFDADGDGDLDLASASVNSSFISFFRSNGDGSFQAKVDYTIASNATILYSFDADGDGDMDIATANQGTNNISILKNNGSGIFGTRADYPTGTAPWGIYAFDADGDGDMDLATANNTANTISVLFNQPPLNITTLNPARNALNQANNVTVSATTSVNISGASLNFNNAKIYGSQTGFHTAGAWAGAGTSNISYTPTIYPFKKGENITVSYRNTLQGLGGEPFMTTQQYQFTAAATGGFANFSKPNPDVSVSTTPVFMCNFDADGDGDIDVASANFTANSLSVSFNNGNGTFTAPANYGVGSNPRSVFAFDADNDGDLDLACANDNSTNISVLFNNGSGLYSGRADYVVGTNPYDVSAFDADGDGDLDLAVAVLNNPSVSIFLNNGSGTFSLNAHYTVPSPFGLFAFDADSDGDIDIATASNAGNVVSIIFNNGNGTYTAPTNYATGGTGCRSVFAFDGDGDGDLDLAVANAASDNIGILKNNGNGTFGTATNYAAGTTPWGISAFDADGDGDMDLGIANYASNTVSVLLNNGAGTGTFATAKNFTFGSAPRSINAFDADADGDMDLAMVNESANTISVLFNQSTSLAFSTAGFNESVLNNGTFANFITATLTADTFTGINGDNFVGTKLIVNNLPAGITASAIRNGTNRLDISLLASSTHALANSIANLGFTFQNTAFTVNSAANVLNFSTANFQINYIDPYSLSFSTTDFNESVLDNGDIQNTLTITLSGNQTWTDAIPDGQDLVFGTDYTVSNLPSGYLSTITKNNANTLTVSLTNNNPFSNYSASESISNLGITFLASAFQNADPNSVINNPKTDFLVNFIGNLPVPLMTINMGGVVTNGGSYHLGNTVIGQAIMLGFSLGNNTNIGFNYASVMGGANASEFPTSLTSGFQNGNSASMYFLNFDPNSTGFKTAFVTIYNNGTPLNPNSLVFTNKTIASGLGSLNIHGVYAFGNNVYAATFGGLSISPDRGASWTNKTNANSGLANDQVHSVYVEGNNIYAGTNGGGLAISNNNGTSFTNKTTSHGLGSDIVFGAYAFGNNIYVATTNGISISTNNGTSFTNKTTANGLLSNSCYAVYAIGTNVYVCTASGLAISTDGGNNFTNKTTLDGLGNNFCRSVLVIGNTIYLATDGGLSISTDGGNSFTNKTTANGLGANVIRSVYVNGATIYAGTIGGLSASLDGGNTFTNKTLTNGLPSDQVYGVCANGNEVYVATFGGGLSVANTPFVFTLTGNALLDLSLVSINVPTNQITNTNFPMQYSLDSPDGINGTWLNCTSASTSVVFTTGNIYVRDMNYPTNNRFITALAFASAPAPVGFLVDVPNNQILATTNFMEFTTDGGASWQIAGNPKTFLTFTTGMMVAVRTAATATSLPSQMTTAVLISPNMLVYQNSVNVPNAGIYNFGSVIAEYSSPDIYFKIQNSGYTNLNLSGINISGTDANSFFMTSNFVTTDLVFGTNFITFSVKFSPNSAGNKTALLSIPNNDPNKNPFTINLFATATANQAVQTFILNNHIIPEKQYLGYTIGRFIVTTAKPNQSFTFRLKEITGNVYNEYFTLVGNILQTNGVFDYELFTDPATQKSIPIPCQVEVTDSDGKTFDKIFTLYVGPGLPFDSQKQTLTPLSSGQILCFDENQDASFDLLISGKTAGNLENTSFYLNKNGSAAGMNYQYALAAVKSEFSRSNIAVADLNNDNFADIIVSGSFANLPVLQMYLYNSEKIGFVTASQFMTALVNTSIAVADYDADGDQDVAMLGLDQNQKPKTVIYENLGKAVFQENTKISLKALHSGTIKWADLNNDGYQDLLLNGLNSAGKAENALYLNDKNGNLLPETSSITALYKGDFAFADLDHNGFLDLVITGSDGKDNYSQIYLNEGGKLTEKTRNIKDTADLLPLSGGAVALADYDSDGWIDLAISGNSGDSALTLIYKNYIGKKFILLPKLLPLSKSSLAFMDIDNDKRPDLLISGIFEDKTKGTKTPVMEVLSNSINSFNQVPSKPKNIKAKLKGQNIIFSWESANDKETPSKSLTYNVYIKDAKNNFILSPLANLEKGNRYVLQEGNMQNSNTFELKNVPFGKYTWGVQSIDGNHLTSEFAKSTDLDADSQELNVCPDIEYLEFNTAQIVNSCAKKGTKIAVKWSLKISPTLDSTQITIFWREDKEKADSKKLIFPKRFKSTKEMIIDTVILLDPNTKYLYHAQAQNACNKKLINADSTFRTPVIFGKNVIGNESKAFKNKAFDDLFDLDSLPSTVDTLYLGIVWQYYDQKAKEWLNIEKANDLKLKGFVIDDDISLRRILKNKLVKNCADTSNVVKIEYMGITFNESDYTFLMQFFAKYGNRFGWNLNNPVSSWRGVGIEKGRLTSLDLSGANLDGEFPDFGEDNALVYLNLSNNSFVGKIPPSIKNLKHLQYLDLSNNNFRGKVPTEINALQDLRTLFLSHNYLEDLGEGVGELYNLRTLFVNENYLTYLPANLGNLRELLTLNASSNSLTSLPETLEKLSKIESFYVEGNKIKSLPAGFSKLVNLRFLYAFNNLLTNLPDFSKLENLEIVSIYANYLDFGALEKLLLDGGGRGTFLAEYSPQAKLTTDLDSIILTDINWQFNLLTGGKNNLYQWYKDDQPLNILFAQSPILKLNAITKKDAGVYYLSVRNTKIKNLILRSGNINLQIACANTLNYEIKADKALTFCEGANNAPILSIKLPKNFKTQWLLNKIPILFETKTNIQTTVAGAYSLQINDSSGCIIYTNALQINPLSAPAVIISNKDGRIVAKSKEEIVKYEWFFNNNLLDNANDSTILTEKAGDYFVKVYSKNNCTGLSNVISFKITATENQNLAEQVKIYPNPIQNRFFVESENLGIDGIKIYNSLGQKIEDFAVKNSKKIEIDLQNYPQGLYLLEISGKNGKYRQQIVKE